MKPVIRLHNTLTGKKEALRTLVPDRVTMYVCGPTVYDYAHLGNARPAVVFDVLARLLRHDYAELVYARNFTDIDDKINAAAAAQGVSIAAIADRYIDAYHGDMRALGVAAPDLEPRVTAHIPAIIDLVQTLIARGHAYVSAGHVLFHVRSYAEYGRLSRRRAEDMLAGARIEVAPYKSDPLDFVLWKPSLSAAPGWDSPWGRGRPGWHVECSAMISQHLGHTIDIHGGGQDLIFPHHENEIAQGTCAYGQRYCQTWVHNSFVTVNGQKMSKSMGNVLLVRDLLRQAPGEAIQLALLATHYRYPFDWNAQRLSGARRMLRRYYESLARVHDVTASGSALPDPTVLAALRNDMNVPLALARLRALLTVLDDAETVAAQSVAKARLLKSAALLGLLRQPAHVALQSLCAHSLPQSGDADLAAQLLNERSRARRERDFARADALRLELARAGFAIQDKLDGPVLRPFQQEN
ncbi:cysteine--tRNA ligase [Chitinasiproducens palmae]|uniref:Cysteine--tRNA ligase n=1 Tax=Chitinasiproducens palmae TaxID=1770053 RepID=A0A1H2PJ96_9BURK|nr:cysteine--tRNA ligase [Chitinasiproducens palmae]SDV46445.1 cysteinyl-tRNA synthetase [Chitinasiproducens palmae]